MAVFNTIYKHGYEKADVILKMAFLKDRNNWFEWFRIITPIGIFVIGIWLNWIRSDIQEIKTQLFHHLVNGELHTPRATIVNRDEFVIYQSMRDKQMSDIKECLSEIKKELKYGD